MPNQTITQAAVAALRSAAEALTAPAAPSPVAALVDALHTGDAAKVTASTIGRIWQHVQGRQDESFVIATPWRSDVDEATNQARLAEFKLAVRKLGLGYIMLVGHWAGQKEPSFFIPGMALKDAHSLCVKYNQDAVVYAGPENGGKIDLVDQAGHHTTIANKVSMATLGDSFSELARARGNRQRNFTLVKSAATQGEFMAAVAYEAETYAAVPPLYATMTRV